ncbi:MAG: hypothetical protein RLZZ488_2851 [Pseudomonadota bacterium]|jgi:hypothetical protein
MEYADRLFTLRLKDESFAGHEIRGGLSATRGELWHGDGRVPVAGVTSYRGRVDAVITFFVDQFLNDELFQEGDSLAIAVEQGEPVVLVKRSAQQLRPEVN